MSSLIHYFELQGDHAFAENQESPQYETREQRIAAELWRWHSLPREERAIVAAARSDLQTLIMFYLCDVFHVHNSAPSSGWWCDGIDDLLITMLAERHFFLVGVAIWAEGQGSFNLAPFELEFEFDEIGALDTSRIVVRFGRLDKYDRIEKTPFSASAWSLLKRRPERDADWAFAVELS